MPQCSFQHHGVLPDVRMDIYPVHYSRGRCLLNPWVVVLRPPSRLLSENRFDPTNFGIRRIWSRDTRPSAAKSATQVFAHTMGHRAGHSGHQTRELTTTTATIISAARGLRLLADSNTKEQEGHTKRRQGSAMLPNELQPRETHHRICHQRTHHRLLAVPGPIPPR